MAKSKNATPAIVAYDPYLQTSFAFSDNKIQPVELSKANKNSYFVSYVKYKDLIVGNVEIPSSTEEDDVSNLITIKAYELFNLDPAAEYKIVYNEFNGVSSENKIFNVFILDVLSGDKLLSLFVKKMPYIDYVVAAPLAFEALYKKNILSAQNVDAFIVMQEDDAFIAVYQNGEYAQSRPFRYSSRTISEKFSTLSGDKLNDSSFFNIIKDGTNTPNERNKSFIVEIFDEIIYYTSDVIDSLNRFGGANVSNLYIVSDVPMGDFCECIKEKIGLIASNLNVSVAINSKEIQASTLNEILIVNAQYYQETHDNSFNFSNFLRPLPLFQRSSGKLIMYSLLGILGGIAWPIYLYVFATITDIDTADKRSELEVNQRDLQRIEAELARLQQEKNNITANIGLEEEKMNFRKNTISEIYNKKVEYPMKSIVLFELSNLINNKDIQTAKIVNSNRDMKIMLVSKDEKKLTELIQNISNSDKYSITTKEISLDKKYGVPSYETNVTIKIK